MKKIYAAVVMTGDYEDKQEDILFVCENEQYVKTIVQEANKLLDDNKLSYHNLDPNYSNFIYLVYDQYNVSIAELKHYDKFDDDKAYVNLDCCFGSCVRFKEFNFVVG